MSVDNNNKFNNPFFVKSLNPQDPDFIINVYQLLNHIKTLDSKSKSAYKQYVSKYFNEIDREIFMRFPLTENTKIELLDNEYIVLEYRVEVKRRFGSYNITRHALIGYDNTQNCLFINIMDNKVFSRSQLNFITHIYEIEDINEYLENVKEDYVRVQGDLVFRIKLYDKEVEDTLKVIIYETLATEYNRILANDIIQKLINYLNNVRISVNNVRVVNIFPNMILLRLVVRLTKAKNKNKYRDSLARIVNECLAKLNGTSDLISNFNMAVGAYNFSDITELVVDIDIFLNRDKLEKILQIEEILNNLLSNPGEYTVVYGNHTVKYYGLPNTFNVSLSIDNRILTTTITLSTLRFNPMIIAYPGNITITHSEHGEVLIRLKHKVRIILDNTNVSEKDTLIRNRISLKRFL